MNGKSFWEVLGPEYSICASKTIPNAVYTPALPPLLIQKQGGQGGTYKSRVYLEVFQLFATPDGPDVTTQFTTQREEYTMLQMVPKYVKWQNAIKGTKK